MMKGVKGTVKTTKGYWKDQGIHQGTTPKGQRQKDINKGLIQRITKDQWIPGRTKVYSLVYFTQLFKPAHSLFSSLSHPLYISDFPLSHS